MFHRVACLTLLVVLAPCLPARAAGDAFAGEPRKVMKTDAEWARQLTRAQYLVCRRKATEPPFSGKYVNNHARGIYTCVCCDEPLFSSQAKFDSGTGWPSFWRPLAPGQIDTEMDYSTGEPRVEVMCHACGAHLGHVFNDGPPPTGLRYCINSVALKFVREPKPSQESTTTGKEKAEPASRASQSGADERPQQ